MSYINDIVSGGIDPLQDTDRDMDVAFRTVRFGCRVVDRDSVGDLVIDRQSIGDQTGWVLWHQIAGARPCPAYAQAWPARVVNAASGGGTGTAADFFAVLPVGINYDYDARWGVKTPTVGRVAPGSRQRAWNRAPRGQVGIVVSTTDEYNPTELFMPTDPRMIAVNVRGSGEMGSIVCDLDASNNYDATRYARLQTMMRVVPLGTSNGIPGFVPDPESEDGGMLGAIAWNLALTGRDRALGRGLVIDQQSAAMPPPPELPPVPTGQGTVRDPVPPPPPPPPPAPPPPPGMK